MGFGCPSEASGSWQHSAEAGDRVLDVNGYDDVEEMSGSLTDLSKRKIVLHMERGEAKKASPQADTPDEDSDSTFVIELQPISPGAESNWGFQLEGAAEVRNILDGSPLAMWNIVSRSRGGDASCKGLVAPAWVLKFERGAVASPCVGR